MNQAFIFPLPRPALPIYIPFSSACFGCEKGGVAKCLSVSIYGSENLNIILAISKNIKQGASQVTLIPASKVYQIRHPHIVRIISCATEKTASEGVILNWWSNLGFECRTTRSLWRFAITTVSLLFCTTLPHHLHFSVMCRNDGSDWSKETKGNE